MPLSAWGSARSRAWRRPPPHWAPPPTGQINVTFRQAPRAAEAASASFYSSPGWSQDYPRLQILTVEELLSGKRLNAPPIGQVSTTFRRAPRAGQGVASTLALPLAEAGS